MSKTYPEWLKQVAEAQFPPIVALGGEERAFVEEALLALKKRFLTGELSDFNFDVFSAKTTPVEALVSAAQVLPVMSNHRLIFVTEAEAVKSENIEVFEKYAKAPNPATVLVFIFDVVDARSKFQKILENLKALYKFDHPKEREILSLIRSRAQQKGLKISEEIASFLLMEIGNSLLLLDRVLEKLELICENGLVTLEQIEQQVTQTAFRDAFALARAVILKDRAKAASCLAELKSAQEVPLRLVGVLAWQFRVVLKARLYLDDKRSASDIASRLSLFGDRLDVVLKAARLLDAQGHAKRLTMLSELDRSLKSSRAPAWLLFDDVVLSML